MLGLLLATETADQNGSSGNPRDAATTVLYTVKVTAVGPFFRAVTAASTQGPCDVAGENKRETRIRADSHGQRRS